jgi:hypothetical protein
VIESPVGPLVFGDTCCEGEEELHGG